MVEETHSRTDETQSLDRRNCLKWLAASNVIGSGIAVSGTVSAGNNCGFDGTSGNYDEINSESEKNEVYSEENIPSGSGYEYAIENRSSAIHGSSEVIDGRWLHTFYTGSYIMTKRRDRNYSDYNWFENVYSHRLSIDNKKTSTSSLYTTDNPYDIGAAPSPSGSTDGDYGDAAYTVFKILLSVASAKLATAVSAAELTSQMLDNGESDDSYGYREYTWAYDPSSLPCEASNYCHFMIRNHDDYSTARVKIHEYAVADMGNVNSSVSFTYSVDPMGNIQSIDSDEVLDMEEQIKIMENSEKFKKIPYEEIENKTKKELANGNPIYRALDPDVSITSQTGAPEKYAPW